VSLLDRFLDMCDRLVAWQDSADAKKAGLHDCVDAPTHSDLFCERIGIDGEEANLFLNDLALHLLWQKIPNQTAVARRVQQKDSALCGVLEHIDLVDKIELMAGHE